MRASGCSADFGREPAQKAKRAIASLWRNLRWRRSRALPPRRSLISLAQHAEGYSEADRHCNATCNRGDVSRPAVGGKLSIRQRRPAPKKKEAISISSRSRSSTQCHDTLPQHFRDQGVAFELTKRVCHLQERMSAAWAIDMNGFSSDVRDRLVDWGQRTSARTGFDEKLFIFVRKKETTKQALSHLLRNLARNWNVDLPGGWDWLRPMDCVKAEEVQNAPKMAPTPTVEQRAPFVHEIYRSILSPDFAEQARKMIEASA